MDFFKYCNFLVFFTLTSAAFGTNHNEDFQKTTPSTTTNPGNSISHFATNEESEKLFWSLFEKGNLNELKEAKHIHKLEFNHQTLIKNTTWIGSEFFSALKFVCDRGHADIAAYLLSQLRIEAWGKKWKNEYLIEEVRPALTRATQKGHTDIVSTFIKEKLISHRERYIQAAITSGRAETTEFLLNDFKRLNQIQKRQPKKVFYNRNWLSNIPIEQENADDQLKIIRDICTGACPQSNDAETTKVVLKYLTELLPAEENNIDFYTTIFTKACYETNAHTAKAVLQEKKINFSEVSEKHLLEVLFKKHAGYQKTKTKILNEQTHLKGRHFQSHDVKKRLQTLTQNLEENIQLRTTCLETIEFILQTYAEQNKGLPQSMLESNKRELQRAIKHKDREMTSFLASVGGVLHEVEPKLQRSLLMQVIDAYSNPSRFPRFY